MKAPSVYPKSYDNGLWTIKTVMLKEISNLPQTVQNYMGFSEIPSTASIQKVIREFNLVIPDKLKFCKL